SRNRAEFESDRKVPLPMTSALREFTQGPGVSPYQPVKYSVEPDGSHWLEVHEPLSRNRAEFESDRKVPLPMTSALREFTQGPGVSP
ncbi:hypothetical protein, partial [Enterococcus faecium]|uniref:hypothetical protein n=1 Tax=Enterococcus faecium TaxID=1352 RepID=UPI003FA00900